MEGWVKKYYTFKEAFNIVKADIKLVLWTVDKNYMLCISVHEEKHVEYTEDGVTHFKRFLNSPDFVNCADVKPFKVQSKRIYSDYILDLAKKELPDVCFRVVKSNNYGIILTTAKLLKY